MIHEEICTYEVCKLAKEKGFDLHCVPFYALGDFTAEYVDDVGEFYEVDFEKGCLYLNYPVRGLLHKDNMLSAPTHTQLQRWLRKEKGIIVEVFVDDDSNMPLTYNIHQYKDWSWECVCHHHGNYYAVTDWELCLEDALKYALENLV